MEQSPYWEAKSNLTSQEFLLPLWNSTLHFRVHKSQMSPVHNPNLYSFKIYCNIILPPMPRSLKQYLLFRFYD